jgi:glyoxylase-like metal-dependent hydrolase (beta-lactamase superfamily II)
MDGSDAKPLARPVLDYPFGEKVPEVGETIEVAPNVFWLRMPLPFSLQWINLWLIDDGERGWTIVDTGMPLEETKQAWRQIFERQLNGRSVWRIIVTHMHPDHIGNAGWLSRKFPDAQLWISRLEYVSCRMLIADTGREAPEAGVNFYKRAGWTEPQIDVYRSRFGSFGRAISRLPDAYHRLQDGEQFEMGGDTWQVIMGNGHSPEHACLLCEAKNVLISGDQLLPKISSNVSVHPTEPDEDPLSDWLNSCEKLRGAVPEDVLVLPAHNEPFVGAHPRLDHLIRGHHVALKRLKQRLGQSPKRAVDTFLAVFGRSIGDDQLSMATGEAIAHLNYLVRSGEAVAEPDEAGVLWYRST